MSVVMLNGRRGMSAKSDRDAPESNSAELTVIGALSSSSLSDRESEADESEPLEVVDESSL